MTQTFNSVVKCLNYYVAYLIDTRLVLSRFSDWKSETEIQHNLFSLVSDLTVNSCSSITRKLQFVTLYETIAPQHVGGGKKTKIPLLLTQRSQLTDAPL